MTPTVCEAPWRPILRYHGGKWRLAPWIISFFPKHRVYVDPFMGSGTTAQVAQRLGRMYLGCELNPEYAALQRERTQQPGLVLA